MFLKKHTRLALHAILIILTTVTIPAVYAALLSNSVTIGSSGTIKAIGVDVYWDNSCTDPVLSLDWGSTLEPGSTVDKTIHIKNSGNTAVTLSLDAENWNPSSAYDHMSLSWDYSGQPIDPDGVLEVTLTLSISQGISGISGFSVDIIISASG